MYSTVLFKKFSLAVLFIMTAMSCSCAVKPAVTVTASDSGTRVEIKSGDVLAVKLEAQLGTGFGWKVVSLNENLVQEGEAVQTPKGTGKPGGPEYQTFRFKAGKKGEAELRLQYAQGWHKGTKPLKEFAITVIIK
jgi:predicted secreted protein